MSSLPTPLPPYLCSVMHAMHQDRQHHSKKNTNCQQGKTTRQKTRQTKTNHHHTSERRRRKKKKQAREHDLGVVVEQGVRVQEGERGRDEETQGESQTPEKGFGFPQHLRKRDKEKTAPTKYRTQKRERERGDSKHLGRQGSGPEGRQTKHHSNPRDKKKHQTEYPTSIPEKPNINQIPNQQSLGGLVTAGWRGPWAALHFWGVTPGDRSTEGYKYPPTTGTAPGGAKSGQPTRHKTNTPKVLSQHLAVLRLPNKTADYQADTKWEPNRHQAKTNTRNVTDTFSRHSSSPERCPGGATWTRLGTAPLCFVSEMLAISGVCDVHRNRKSQKSLRFRCTKALHVGQVARCCSPPEMKAGPRNSEKIWVALWCVLGKWKWPLVQGKHAILCPLKTCPHHVQKPNWQNGTVWPTQERAGLGNWHYCTGLVK